MKVTLINTFHTSGGAAVACRRLWQALNKTTDVESALLVQEKTFPEAQVTATAATFLEKKLARTRFALDRLYFALHEKNKEVRFAFSPANIGTDISTHPLVQQADILHLHWINFGFLNKKLLKEMAVYGVFILLGGAGALIISQIDALMLGSMAGTREVAIYTIAYYIGTIIEIPRRAIAQISTPIISQAWAHNDIDKIEDIYHKSAINQLIIGCFFFLGIWCNVDAIFNLIPNGEIYRPGKYVILFIGLTRLFDMATGVNGEIILQSRYYRFNLVSVAILAILLVVTNWIFIPLYGINGAAFATALSVFLYNILKYVFLWVKFRIQPFTIKTAVVLLVAVITYFVASLIPAPAGDFINTAVNILIRSSIITVLFASCMFVFQVSDEANHLVKTGYEKLRLFFK